MILTIALMFLLCGTAVFVMLLRSQETKCVTTCRCERFVMETLAPYEDKQGVVHQIWRCSPKEEEL